MKTTSPKHGVNDGKQHRIIQAARERFATYGYTKVTMDDIAGDLGVTKPSLYYYFPTKDDVLRSVVRQEQQEFLSGLTAFAERRKSVSTILQEYARRRVALAGTLMNLNRLDLSTWHHLKPVVADLFDDFAQQEIALIQHILHDGVTGGELDVSSPRKTATLIVHVLQGLRLRSPRQLASPTAEDMTETFRTDSLLFIDHLLHGLRRTVSGTPSSARRRAAS